MLPVAEPLTQRLVAELLAAVPTDQVMRQLAEIVRHDRYQASLGIEAAAAFVAEQAEACGLTAVTIERQPADGERRWWSWRAPVAWTPLIARLQVRSGGSVLWEIDHAEQPFTVATYSAPFRTEPSGVPLLAFARGALHELRGCVVALRRADFEQGDVLCELEAAGALGFVTDATARSGTLDEEYPGRIELPSTSRLFGFSAKPSQLQRLHSALVEGLTAHVVLKVDRSASMPVVSGVLPGRETEEEVWLTAHLCHPRPGANDNGSGVAALLGVAAAHARRQPRSSAGKRRGLRCVWGPEFLGIAAATHACTLGKNGRVLPSAVINLDMVGEDQGPCGSPFFVEQGPDFRPALITPLAEQVVAEVFHATRAGGGTWRSAPFMGFSDHALFASKDLACPAVQLCHVPDRFNHSAADTLDKVSPLEMRRSMAAAAALTELLAAPNELHQVVLQSIVQAWCEKERSTLRTTLERYQSTTNQAWARGLSEHVESHLSAMLRLASGASSTSDSRSAAPLGPRVVPRFAGPFNARAMQEVLSPSSSRTLSALVREDKLNLALLSNLALRADGSSNRRELAERATLALRRPVASGNAARLLDLLLESGWLEEAAASA
jgi:hypothetical protein